MKNTIEFSQASNTNELASGYTIQHKSETGEVIQFRINGLETVTSVCPDCGKTFSVSFAHFIEMMAFADSDFYGFQYCCEQCNKNQSQESR